MFTATHEYFGNQILWNILVQTMTTFQNGGENGEITYALCYNSNLEGLSSRQGKGLLVIVAQNKLIQEP